MGFPWPWGYPSHHPNFDRSFPYEPIPAADTDPIQLHPGRAPSFQLAKLVPTS